MFSPKQFNPFFALILITLAFFLSNCSKDENEETVAVVDCCSSGSAIIKGTVEDYDSEALTGVSVTFAKSGTTSSTVATIDNGTYSKSTFSSGTYTLTYTKNGYIETSQSATLTADDETLEVGLVQLFPDTCASTGTISGTIKDAVSESGITDVSLSARSGLDATSGTIVKTATSDSSGNYSLSSMSTGWYTIETSKSGYVTDTFNAFACDDQSGQNGFITTTPSSGSLRIVLSWQSNKDLDGHLTGPDNASGKFHVYFDQPRFHYDNNSYTDSGSSSDNVTLDVDTDSKGPETITVSAVRSGTYRYYVHNYNERGKNSLLLAASEASVKVYYNDNGTTNVTTFNVPNSAADLWYVFDFDNSSGFTAVNNMGSDDKLNPDIFAPTLAEVTPVTTRTNDTTPNYTFSSNEAGTIAYGGSCSSDNTSATVDNNTITFRKPSGGGLDEGTYSNCTITVTDDDENTSDNLSVSSFTIDTTLHH